MAPYTIRHFLPEDASAVVELQRAYAHRYPGAAVIPGEVYFSPGFEDGQNIFCAVDETGRLCGYAPLYPALIETPGDEPHVIWAEIKTDPAVEPAQPLKDLLFEQVLVRARELAGRVPGHAAHLMFQYLPGETESITFVQGKGSIYAATVFRMVRDLTEEVPGVVCPPGIVLRRWRMESEAEQRAYVQARNECFPEAPVTLKNWQYFMQSPEWAVGAVLTAFDGDQVVGSVAVYWSEAEIRDTGWDVGFTEDIFVRPAWRGRGIARALVSAALVDLKQHGRQAARLEVKAENDQALRLYRSLGYQVVHESRLYRLPV